MTGPQSIKITTLFFYLLCIGTAHCLALTELSPLASGDAPALCQLENGDLILAYSRNVKIYYKTSKDAGQSWSSEIQLTYDNVNVSPALMQDSTNKLWLVWTSSALGQYDLEYATSTDNGLTWDTRGLVFTPQESSQRGSIIETDDNRIWVFWSRPGNYVTSEDGGQTWTDLAEMGVDMWNNPFFYRARDNQFWVVGWTGRDIWARNSDNGLNWSAPIKITDNDLARYPRVHPVIGQDTHGNLVAVWHSEHHEPNNPDIWYSTSFNNGVAWHNPKRLTYHKNIDMDPTLAVIDDALWVFWSSDRTGNDTIYPSRLNLNPCDFDNDHDVDFDDYAMFTFYWKSDYSNNGDVPRLTDADQSGTVDIMDLVIFADYWLEPTPHEVPDVDTIAYWKLDETEGIIAHESIESNDGTLNGNPNWQPSTGKIDGALKFNGINNYISTDFMLNPLDGSFSVFAWIKGGGPGQVIISQTDHRVGRIVHSGSTWLGIDPSDGKLITSLMDPQFNLLESDTIITDGQWYHVGLVYDLDESHRYLYVDGVEVAKDVSIVGGVPSTGSLCFGVGKDLEEGSFFSGLIDDVRIYNVALSADKIKELAH